MQTYTQEYGYVDSNSYVAKPRMSPIEIMRMHNENHKLRLEAVSKGTSQRISLDELTDFAESLILEG